MSERQSRDLLFEVHSALGCKICLTRPYWLKILRDKHPGSCAARNCMCRELWLNLWKYVGASPILTCISTIAGIESDLSAW